MLPSGEVKDTSRGSLDYYERLKVESEIRERCDRVVFNSELERRWQKHQLQKESKLNEKRSKLVELLRWEEQQNRELCRYKIEEERKASRKALMEAAVNLKKEARERDEKTAAEMYRLRFVQNNVPLREIFTKLHEAEIMKDRAQIAKLKAAHLEMEAKETEVLNKQKSHFEEQLEREEQEARAMKNMAYDCVEDYKRAVREKQEERAREKQDELEEGKRLAEKIKQEEIEDTGSLAAQKAKREELMKMIQDDIALHREIREKEELVDRVVSSYVNPALPPLAEKDDREEKETRRKELVKFLNYQKDLAHENACFEKYVDKCYTEMAEKRRAQEKERKRRQHEKAVQLAKEIAVCQRQAVDNRIAEEKMRQAKIKEDGEELRKKLKEEEERTRKEEIRRRMEGLKVGRILLDQIHYEQERKKRTKDDELKREREAMLQAEIDYQNKLAKAMEENPLLEKLHPWRSPALRNW
ncbi:unnamed protein product [Calicophoron daubneyi]|uniref:Trichohyalin-plectin-homology domain-containing protein n=1 Tax=Calicophoron daubneyi TaxID=300641 RepID=A0AAV2T5A8_CALDB